MCPEARAFLALKRKPSVVDLVYASYLTGLKPHALATLISLGLLVPLGKPRKSAPKLLSTARLEELHADPKFWHKAMMALQAHWRQKRYAGSKSARGNATEDSFELNGSPQN